MVAVHAKVGLPRPQLAYDTKVRNTKPVRFKNFQVNGECWIKESKKNTSRKDARLPERGQAERAKVQDIQNVFSLGSWRHSAINFGEIVRFNIWKVRI